MTSPGFHAIAFGDRNLEHPAADFRRDLHFGGLDLTRDARRSSRGARAARPERDERRGTAARRDDG